jgi:hypothetical protein
MTQGINSLASEWAVQDVSLSTIAVFCWVDLLVVGRGKAIIVPSRVCNP